MLKEAERTRPAPILRRPPIAQKASGHRLNEAGLPDEKTGPRILIVTPEIASLPDSIGMPFPKIAAKSGGLADIASLLMDALTARKTDVHVALPHFRRIFGVDPHALGKEEWRSYKMKPNEARLHLAEDRQFYYRDRIYSYESHENPNVALAFQREVINNIIPRVQPDIIHCHDWMTGLIPAAAKRLGIPCLFTIHNVHTERISLAHMENMGIDAAEFWESLYLEHYPWNYQESRNDNPADLLASAILASNHVNTVSPSFLDELIGGQHPGLPGAIRERLWGMREAGVACGILNAPHPSYSPETDSALKQTYDPESCIEGKTVNKAEFQKRVGLEIDPQAPLYFWPSRLDPTQKGCQLLTEILYQLTLDYESCGLQLALVADGIFQEHFKNIVDQHELHDRVAVCDFDEGLSRLGYGASDFTLMPSFFEPCGLSQMIAARYGSLPIVHRTGGLRDTVQALDPFKEEGNGFVFETPDSGGLRWAINESMNFYSSGTDQRFQNISRIMRESREAFGPDRVVENYLQIYERLTKASFA